MTTPLDRINEKIEILEIAKHIGLLGGMRQYGNIWKGLCPFHSEKTPSFVITKSRGRFHCFGCGADGDAVDLYCKIKGIQVTDAIPELNSILGIQDLGYEPLHAPMPRRRAREEPLPEKYAHQPWRLSGAIAIATQTPTEVSGWWEFRGWERSTLTFLAETDAIGWCPLDGLKSPNEPKDYDESGTMQGGLHFFFERGIKCRPDLLLSKSTFWKQGSAKHCAWRVERCDPSVVKTAFIFEGETDCISALSRFGEREDTAFLGQPGASWVPTPELAHRIGNRRSVMLCGDSDEAGAASNVRLAEHFQNHCDCRVYALNWKAISRGQELSKGYGVDELLSSHRYMEFYKKRSWTELTIKHNVE